MHASTMGHARIRLRHGLAGKRPGGAGRGAHPCTPARMEFCSAVSSSPCCASRSLLASLNLEGGKMILGIRPGLMGSHRDSQSSSSRHWQTKAGAMAPHWHPDRAGTAGADVDEPGGDARCKPAIGEAEPTSLLAYPSTLIALLPKLDALAYDIWRSIVEESGFALVSSAGRQPAPRHGSRSALCPPCVPQWSTAPC